MDSSSAAVGLGPGPVLIISSNQMQKEAAAKCLDDTFKGWGALSTLCTFALLIISCVGAAGVLPGSTFGWTAVGLGAGSFAFKLLRGDLRNHKTELAAAAAEAVLVIALGALAGLGMIPTASAGGVIIPILLITPFGWRCIKNLQEQKIAKPSV